MIKYRVEMRNNADARRADGTLDFLECGAKARHNGGKVLFVFCSDEEDAHALESAMDSAPTVASYERV